MATSATSSTRHSKRRKTESTRGPVVASNRAQYAITPGTAKKVANECYEKYLKNYRARSSPHRWTMRHRKNMNCEYYFGPRGAAVNDVTYFTDAMLAREVCINRKGKHGQKSDDDCEYEEEHY